MKQRHERPTPYVRRPPRVLMVDDEAILRTLVARVLSRLGCLVDLAESGADAKQRVLANRPALVIVDLHLPDTDGLSLIAELRALLEPTPPRFIVMSGASRPADLPESVATFLQKPVSVDALMEAAKDVIGPNA